MLACCTGETASAVIVLESAVRQYEDILGVRHPGISTLSKKAENLLSGLEPERREQVSCSSWVVDADCCEIACSMIQNMCAVLQVVAKCQRAADVVKQIIETFAEKPDVYKHASGKRRAVEVWSEGGLGNLTPLT